MKSFERSEAWGFGGHPHKKPPYEEETYAFTPRKFPICGPYVLRRGHHVRVDHSGLALLLYTAQPCARVLPRPWHVPLML
jgi:hypothetical protein